MEGPLHSFPHPNTRSRSSYLTPRALVTAILFGALLGQVLEAVKVSWEGVTRGEDMRRAQPDAQILSFSGQGGQDSIYR